MQGASGEVIEEAEREAAARGAGGRVSAGRLRVGLLTVLAAVVVNLIIRTFAVTLFGLLGSLPLTVGPTVVFTVAGVLGAVAVFALMARFARVLYGCSSG